MAAARDACAHHARLGLRVAEALEQRDPGNPVDHTVVRLDDLRPAVVGQMFDNDDLPQRMVAVQSFAQFGRHQLPQPRLVTRVGQRGPSDMVCQIEIRLLFPFGRSDVERCPTDPLPQSPMTFQTAVHGHTEFLPRRATPVPAAAAATAHLRETAAVTPRKRALSTPTEADSSALRVRSWPGGHRAAVAATGRGGTRPA